MGKMIEIQAEVARALDKKRAVVALESTVITHGLPYPDNLETAIMMEEAVREAGSIPATIAIIRGTIRVGLRQSEIEYLAQRPMDQVRKCSRRDIALAVARGEDGATTVAGTMIVAEMAGIEIFATGGIGGVHRGHPFDVSADLAELARTPVTVVSSGAKSILDLALTREVLETNGVPIIGYGTDELPAFFSRTSGLKVDLQLNSPEEVAVVVKARQGLSIKSGILVAVPVPIEDEFDSRAAEAAIEQANREANQAGIKGPAATPWLLRRVNELTAGQSMRANISLLRNNGFVAGQISQALAANHTSRTE